MFNLFSSFVHSFLSFYFLFRWFLSLWKIIVKIDVFYLIKSCSLFFIFHVFIFHVFILYFYFLLLKLFNSSVLFCYVILCCISLIHNSILLRMNERRHQDAIGYLFLYFSFLSLTSFSPSSISFPDSMRCTSDQIFFNEILFQLVWRHSKEWINSIL